jgi:hypothetical protein
MSFMAGTFCGADFTRGRVYEDSTWGDLRADFADLTDFMLPCRDRGLRISDTDCSTGGMEAGVDGGIGGWIVTCNAISLWGTGSAAVLLQQFPMD